MHNQSIDWPFVIYVQQASKLLKPVVRKFLANVVTSKSSLLVSDQYAILSLEGGEGTSQTVLALLAAAPPRNSSARLLLVARSCSSEFQSISSLVL